MSESDNLIPSETNQQTRIKCQSHLCVQSKAAILIILWTAFIGAVYAMVCLAFAMTIRSQYVGRSLDSVVTYPVSMLYSILAIVAMLYPLIGFMADTSCGRLKVVLSCCSLIIFSSLVEFICLLANDILIDRHDVSLTINVVSVVVVIVIFIGLGGYQANFIPLGLDQQVSAPSRELALFVHWAMWGYNLGSTIFAICYQSHVCVATNTSSERKAIISTLIFLMIFFLFTLIIGCLKRQWFNSEVRHRNPCKIIMKVLNFAGKHKYPLHRSAFTFADDEIPTRLDFAKAKFGGPFTTEQVEDTKSFFRVCIVLLALGPVFTMEIFSSFMGLMLFGYHASNIQFVNHTLEPSDLCSSWVLIWSGNLKYISGTLLFLVYIWFIFSYLHKRIPRMFARLFVGMLLYWLGGLCLLLTDLAGHIASAKQHSNFNATGLCMFEGNLHLTSYTHLGMHWAVMLPSSILLGLGPLVVKTTALEFISAQSPHFMKGLIVGLFFAIIGLFELVGALAVIPFSVKEVWDSTSMRQNPPVTNCGFGYLTFTHAIVFVGLIIFVVVAKKYTYRVRDDKPYNQSQVEEIFSRYLERPVCS